jgi:tyrosyl-tRNA synthetase
MFGKIMSINDAFIEKYFVLATRVSMAQIQEIFRAYSNPRDQKLVLAREIVALYHGEKAAGKAAEEFTRVFSKREVPTDLKEIKVAVGTSVLDTLLAAGVSSKSEARRLLEQNAVEIDGQRINDLNQKVSAGTLKVGKSRFYRIVTK